MSLTIAELKTKIQNKMSGASLNKFNDVNGKIKEAAGNLLLRIDPYTTIRRYRIENAIYDKVYNYTLPDDVKGISSILDLRPIGERSTADYTDAHYSRDFDIGKKINSLTIEYINGVKTIRISKDLTRRTVLSEMDSLTIGNTITGSGDVENLEMEYLDFISGSASVKFDLSGSTGTGAIKIVLPASVDLSKLVDVGALFHWMKFPDADDLTSVKLKWGTDSTANYYHKTVTSPSDRSAFESNAWTLQRYDWSDATQVGTVDSTAIDTLEIEFTYVNSQQNVRLDSVTSSLGEAWEILYLSNRLFKSSAGSYLESPTDDSDTVLLEIDAENILLYECVKIFAQEAKGSNMASAYKSSERELEGDGRKDGRGKPGLYKLFEAKYPDQSIPQQVEYYKFGNQEDFGTIDDDID